MPTWRRCETVQTCTIRNKKVSCWSRITISTSNLDSSSLKHDEFEIKTFELWKSTKTRQSLITATISECTDVSIR
jgi:hypothetical protein